MLLLLLFPTWKSTCSEAEVWETIIEIYSWEVHLTLNIERLWNVTTAKLHCSKNKGNTWVTHQISMNEIFNLRIWTGKVHHAVYCGKIRYNDGNGIRGNQRHPLPGTWWVYELWQRSSSHDSPAAGLELCTLNRLQVPSLTMSSDIEIVVVTPPVHLMHLSFAPKQVKCIHSSFCFLIGQINISEDFVPESSDQVFLSFIWAVHI